MNLNSGLHYTKKNPLNTNITKIVNLILSNQPIFISNSKYHNNFINKIRIMKKGYSMKNSNLKKYKSSFINDNKTFLNRDMSKINIQNRSNINIKNICNKQKLNKNNNSFYISKPYKYNENIINNEIPNSNISHKKKNKNIIFNQKLKSKLKLKKSKSFSISRNLSCSTGSADIQKITNQNISSGAKSNNKKSRINLTIKGKNKRNSKFYLIKKNKNFSNDLKAKINLYIEQQKKYTQRINKKDDNYFCFIKNNFNKKNKYLPFSNERHKKITKYEKNNTFGNFTTNNSDKENTNNSIKKNNMITNHNNCNNIHYYTTNFNNSTNITETNNDFNNEKFSNRKKILKKKINLPFHPNSKKEDYNINNNSHYDSKKSLIRNNKSEVNIPYNKKNKIKIIRESSTHNFKLINFKNQQNKNYNINNTSREKFNSFIGLYKNQNIINSFDAASINNKSTISKKDMNEFCEGIEMNHFRIVTIIQENKRLLKNNEK